MRISSVVNSTVVLLLASGMAFAQFGPPSAAQIEAMKQAAAQPTPKDASGPFGRPGHGKLGVTVGVNLDF